MRSCSKCGQAITPASAFCPACGAKIPVQLVATPPRSSGRDLGPVDPLASTAPASRSPAAGMSPRAASPPTIVSPKAGTGFQMPQAPAGRGSSPALDQPASAEPTQPERRVLTRGRTAPLAPAPKDAPAPAPPIARVAAPAAPVVAATPAFTAGTRVLVQWANGQKYPGVVERVSGPQCLVRFDAGEQRWVEARFALPVR